MLITYTCVGPFRGSCGHTHRTLSGAVRCLKSDEAGCRRHGGYSDRKIVASGDLTEEEECDLADRIIALREMSR